MRWILPLPVAAAIVLGCDSNSNTPVAVAAKKPAEPTKVATDGKKVTKLSRRPVAVTKNIPLQQVD
jgi:hypothetical protein